MNTVAKNAQNIKIAYIGGGSRGWAWSLMKDLALAKGIAGRIALYDIDEDAAKRNEVIGNRILKDHPEASRFEYESFPTLEQALEGADFVVVSILPGTFKEMGSDVHTPEKYGIYQSVGDTIGPGGVIRALRTVPMYEVIAEAIRDICPNAWVINYTNPMTMCVRAMYRVFPQIKAFGCCHEVFSTQKILYDALEDIYGITGLTRKDIKTNVLGVNHFTWINKAQYGTQDLFPVYREYIERVRAGVSKVNAVRQGLDLLFHSLEMVKFDLFDRFGVMAAAGDRHLAEFCPVNWYMKDKEHVKSWGYGLTGIDWRWNNLKSRMEKSDALLAGEKMELVQSREEGVFQIRALLGLEDLVSNVNIPNMGQIPDLPLGAVVETNATFTSDDVRPVMAGPLPTSIYGLVAPVVGEQEMVVEAALNRDLDLAFEAFNQDAHVQLPLNDARDLFNEMVQNTKEYLPGYKV